MSDIAVLESKTYLEYCLFLERYLEKVEAMEKQMKEFQTASGSKKKASK